MKKKLLVTVGLLASILLAACGGVESNPSTSSEKEVLSLKFANITKENGAWSVAANKLGEILENKTNGRITLEFYPGGLLGNESDMMQQLNTGSIDMAVITTAQLSSSSEAFGAWLMPFVVDSHDQAYQLWTTEESMNLFNTLTKENVHGLGYLTTGFRYMLTTKPVNSIEDLNGFKLRTTPSPTILDYWKTLGASPTPMPLTEVYTAMQTGVINGVDIDSDSLVNEKLTEIAKHLTPDNHMYWAGGLMINKDRWNSLSDEDKKMIEEAVTETMKFNVEHVKKNEQDLLENAVEKYGITNVHELKNRAEFIHHVDSVRKVWSEKSPEIKGFLEKAQTIADN